VKTNEGGSSAWMALCSRFEVTMAMSFAFSIEGLGLNGRGWSRDISVCGSC